MREKIDLNDTTMELLMKMSEGNPGALTVCSEIVKSGFMESTMRLLDLDDMNMRGVQIWVGFKDVCAQDIQSYIKAVKDRNQELVDRVNKECADHVAVRYGGSSR